MKIFWNVEENQTEYYDYVWESFLHLLKEATFLYAIKTLSHLEIPEGSYESRAWAAKLVKSVQPGYICAYTLNLVKVSFQVKIMKKFWLSIISPENHSLTKRLNRHAHFVKKSEYAWAR